MADASRDHQSTYDRKMTAMAGDAAQEQPVAEDGARQLAADGRELPGGPRLPAADRRQARQRGQRVARDHEGRKDEERERDVARAGSRSPRPPRSPRSSRSRTTWRGPGTRRTARAASTPSTRKGTKGLKRIWPNAGDHEPDEGQDQEDVQADGRRPRDLDAPVVEIGEDQDEDRPRSATPRRATCPRACG